MKRWRLQETRRREQLDPSAPTLQRLGLLACVLGEDHEVALAVGRDDFGVAVIAGDPLVTVDSRDPREADPRSFR